MKARSFGAAALAMAALMAPSLGLAQGMADEQGFYVGGSVGEAKVKDFCDTGGAPVVVTSCENKDTAFKIFAGYRFHRHIAAEATYAKLGDLSAGFSLGGTPGTVSADGTSFSLAVLGMLPVSQQFSLFGKLGMAKTEVDARGTIGGLAVDLGGDETELLYGVGVLFNLSPKWGIRAEYEKLDDSGVDMYSIGVQVRF